MAGLEEKLWPAALKMIYRLQDARMAASVQLGVARAFGGGSKEDRDRFEEEECMKG